MIVTRPPLTVAVPQASPSVPAAITWATVAASANVSICSLKYASPLCAAKAVSTFIGGGNCSVSGGSFGVHGSGRRESAGVVFDEIAAEVRSGEQRGARLGLR